MRGPPVPNGRPELVVISVRRYRCVRCDGLCTVVPSGVAPRRHYAATAIGFALALFGLLGMSLSEVRRKVSTWQILGMPADADWVTLRRWIAAVRRGELFGVVRPSPSGSTPRQVAERAAATLCAYAPPSLIGRGLEVQAFHGAARMA